jgi:methylmalonyl-CoA/ethylmalonyl-CoA epimerase
MKLWYPVQLPDRNGGVDDSCTARGTRASTNAAASRGGMPVDLADATVAQILIPVDDFDKGVAFYRDTLGIPFLFAAPPQMAFFACGGVRLLVGVLPPDQKAQRGSAVYFGVADIQGVCASLKGRGVRFAQEPHVVHRTPRSELWLAEFADPDGNQLALMSERSTAAA